MGRAGYSDGGYRLLMPPGVGHEGVVADAVGLLTAGTSVDLLGLAGSGRSRLLAAVADELDDLGWRTLRAAGLAALADRPLEALAVAGLVSRPTRTDARAESVVATAVAQLETATREGRTAVLVDDADDLDAASAGVLAAAQRRAGFPVVTASRPLPFARRPATRLAAVVRPAARVAVPPLGYTDVRVLLDEALPGRIDPGVVARIFAYSGGIPALVRAIADNARRNGTLAVVGGVWTAGADMWSPEIEPVLDPMVAALGDEAREGLELLSLAGAVEVPVARRLVAAPALEELDACGLLRFVGRGEEQVVGVFPQILAEHVRHSAPPARRLRFDDLLAAAFGRSPDHDGPPLVAPRPAPWQEPAAAADPGAEPGAARGRDTIVHRMFVEHWYRRTVECRDAWERSRLPATAVPYVRALLVGGAEVAAVRDVLAATPAEPDPDRELVALRAGVTARVAHDLPAARRLLREAAAADVPWAPRFEVLADHLTLLEDRVPPEREVAVAADAPAATTDAIRLTRAERLVVVGRPAEALPLLDDPFAAPDLARAASALHGAALVLDDRLDDALAWSSAALARARADLDVEAYYAHAYVVSLTLLLRARLTELHGHLDSVLSVGLRAPLEGDYRAANHAIAAALAVLEHRIPVARALSEQALAIGGGRSPLPGMAPAWSTARRGADPDAASGEDRREAADHVWTFGGDLAARGYAMSAAFAGFLSLTLAPDDERAARLVAQAGALPAGLSLRFRDAAAASLLPAGEAAAAGLGLVGDGHGILGARVVVAAVRRLRADGATADASDVLEAARRALAAVDDGAVSLLAGVSAGAELTAREHELARLAATGMPNAEIARRLQLSVRTVENHLYRVSRKLGTEGRAGLARALGLAPPE